MTCVLFWNGSAQLASCEGQLGLTHAASCRALMRTAIPCNSWQAARGDVMQQGHASELVGAPDALQSKALRLHTKSATLNTPSAAAPPLSRSPRSPTTVSYCCGKRFMMASCSDAARAASNTSSSLAPGRPYLRRRSATRSGRPVCCGAKRMCVLGLGYLTACCRPHACLATKTMHASVLHTDRAVRANVTNLMGHTARTASSTPAYTLKSY